MSRRLKGPGGVAVRLGLCWVVTILLAASLKGGLISGSNEKEGISEQLFGSARALIGNRMVVEADRYYHQGVGHTTESVTLSEVLAKWSDAIAPKQHTVLGGRELEEIMPWFRFATKVDPQNVDAYVSAAYWCVRSGHPERAKKVLDEALENNPDDFGVLLAMGHAFRQAGMTAAAEDAYKQGLETWSTRAETDEREMQVQTVELLLSLGSLCEERGAIDEAILYYASLRDRFPEHHAIGDRMAALQRGERMPATEFWNHTDDHRACSHDLAEHEEHQVCSHDSDHEDDLNTHGGHEDCEHARQAVPDVIAQREHVCSDGCAHQH